MPLASLKNMKCKLCLNEKELCDSHIIPEFLYEKLYDEKHRGREFTIEPYKTKFIQKGYREKLLCNNCETEISKLEKYFSDIWKNRIPKIIEQPLYILNNLEYSKFKLFHLSILWRASISSRKEFKQISLGPHEEILRKLILNNDPGPDDKYNFFAKILVHNNFVIQDLIQEPLHSKYEGRKVYVFIYGGCVWHYFVSNRPLKKSIEISFTKKGELILMKEEITQNGYFKDFAKAYRKKKK